MTSLEEAKKKIPDGKMYTCEYYQVWARKNSCFFCEYCTDIWFDYTNGPYMFHCEARENTDKGLNGTCSQFLEELDGEPC